MDADLKVLLTDITNWRKGIVLSGNNTIILNILSSIPQGLPMKSLEDIAVKLGMSRKEFLSTLNLFVMEGKIVKDRVNSGSKGRPTYILKLAKGGAE